MKIDTGLLEVLSEQSRRAIEVSRLIRASFFN